MRLIPREKKFYGMFADVAQNLTNGARILHDILKNPDGPSDRVSKLQAVEHRGDEMTHDIIRMLNQTFITPFDREDIHRLSSSLDDVLDFVNAAAVRMTLYRIVNPPPAAADLAGVLKNPLGENHYRGWLLHLDDLLSQSKTPGSFGWDDTASLVPSGR